MTDQNSCDCGLSHDVGKVLEELIPLVHSLGEERFCIVAMMRALVRLAAALGKGADEHFSDGIDFDKETALDLMAEQFDIVERHAISDGTTH